MAGRPPAFRRSLLEHPDAPPDNNASRTELRPTATYRKVTSGFRSKWGLMCSLAFDPSLVPRHDRERTHIRQSVQPKTASPSFSRVEQIQKSIRGLDILAVSETELSVTALSEWKKPKAGYQHLIMIRHADRGVIATMSMILCTAGPTSWKPIYCNQSGAGQYSLW
jgi:hypothetical protein